MKARPRRKHPKQGRKPKQKPTQAILSLAPEGRLAHCKRGKRRSESASKARLKIAGSLNHAGEPSQNGCRRVFWLAAWKGCMNPIPELSPSHPEPGQWRIRFSAPVKGGRHGSESQTPLTATGSLPIHTGFLVMPACFRRIMPGFLQAEGKILKLRRPVMSDFVRRAFFFCLFRSGHRRCDCEWTRNSPTRRYNGQYACLD